MVAPRSVVGKAGTQDHPCLTLMESLNGPGRRRDQRSRPVVAITPRTASVGMSTTPPVPLRGVEAEHVARFNSKTLLWVLGCWSSENELIKHINSEDNLMLAKDSSSLICNLPLLESFEGVLSIQAWEWNKIFMATYSRALLKK